MTLESDAKFEEKRSCGLENNMGNLGNFSKLGLSWDSLVQSWKYLSLKFTDEFCFMTMKNDAKTDMRNLTNFDPSTQKSQKFALYWAAFDQSI